METRIYLIRHGKAAGNINGIIMGSSIDDDLVEEGVTEAQRTGKLLENVRADAIYSSDLKRSKRTTDIINQYLQCSNVSYTPNLRERNWGSMEGKTYAEVGIEKKDMTGQDSLDCTGKFKESEPLIKVKERLVMTLDEIFREQKHEVLWSSHGFVNSVSASIFQGNDISASNIYRQKNGQVSLFVLDENKKLVHFEQNYAGNAN